MSSDEEENAVKVKREKCHGRKRRKKSKSPLPPYRVGLGTIIWAKLSGFPHWPAKVIEQTPELFKRYQYAKPRLRPDGTPIPAVYVKFFGSPQDISTAIITEGNAKPYLEYKDKYIPKRKPILYFAEAVAEVEALIQKYGEDIVHGANARSPAKNNISVSCQQASDVNPKCSVNVEIKEDEKKKKSVVENQKHDKTEKSVANENSSKRDKSGMVKENPTKDFESDVADKEEPIKNVKPEAVKEKTIEQDQSGTAKKEELEVSMARNDKDIENVKATAPTERPVGAPKALDVTETQLENFNYGLVTVKLVENFKCGPVTAKPVENSKSATFSMNNPVEKIKSETVKENPMDENKKTVESVAVQVEKAISGRFEASNGIEKASEKVKSTVEKSVKNEISVTKKATTASESTKSPTRTTSVKNAKSPAEKATTKKDKKRATEKDTAVENKTSIDNLQEVAIRKDEKKNLEPASENPVGERMPGDNLKAVAVVKTGKIDKYKEKQIENVKETVEKEEVSESGISSIKMEKDKNSKTARSSDVKEKPSKNVKKSETVEIVKESQSKKGSVNGNEKKSPKWVPSFDRPVTRANGRPSAVLTEEVVDVKHPIKIEPHENDVSPAFSISKVKIEPGESSNSTVKMRGGGKGRKFSVYNEMPVFKIEVKTEPPDFLDFPDEHDEENQPMDMTSHSLFQNSVSQGSKRKSGEREQLPMPSTSKRIKIKEEPEDDEFDELKRMKIKRELVDDTSMPSKSKGVKIKIEPGSLTSLDAINEVGREKIERSPPISTRINPPIGQQTRHNPKTAFNIVYGFIGGGAMGNQLALRLLRQNVKLVIWSPELEKCKDKESKGATFVADPGDVIHMADVIFSCFENQQSACKAFFHQKGVCQAFAAGKGYVEMSGVEVARAQDFAACITEKGGRYLVLQVHGTIQEAEKGEVILLGAHDESLFEDSKVALRAMSKQFSFVGELGSAIKIKLLLQGLKTIMVNGTAEMLALAQRDHADQELGRKFVDVLKLPKWRSSLFQEKFNIIENELVTQPVVAVKREWSSKEIAGPSSFSPQQSTKSTMQDIRQLLDWGSELVQETPLAASSLQNLALAKRLGYADQDESFVFCGYK